MIRDSSVSRSVKYLGTVWTIKSLCLNFVKVQALISGFLVNFSAFPAGFRRFRALTAQNTRPIGIRSRNMPGHIHFPRHLNCG